MDLDNVRALIAVVETGSRSAAAGHLGISRGTVRRRVEELEAEAGTALSPVDSLVSFVSASEDAALLVALGSEVVAGAAGEPLSEDVVVGGCVACGTV